MSSWNHRENPQKVGPPFLSLQQDSEYSKLLFPETVDEFRGKWAFVLTGQGPMGL